jgi:hypothetical protein
MNECRCVPGLWAEAGERAERRQVRCFSGSSFSDNTGFGVINVMEINVEPLSAGKKMMILKTGEKEKRNRGWSQGNKYKERKRSGRGDNSYERHIDLPKGRNKILFAT